MTHLANLTEAGIFELARASQRDTIMSNLAEKGAANDGKAATTPLSPSLLDLKTKLERICELDTDGDGIIT